MRDTLVSQGFAGGDRFLTELWETPELDGASGTHRWIQDGEIATYNPSVYSVQRLDVSSIAVGNVSLSIDMRSYNPASGVVETTAPVDSDATALELKSTIEDLDQIL